MYIYNFITSTGQTFRFDVNKQICAKCAIAHANNTLDNSVLQNEVRQFIEQNRYCIINYVSPDDALYVASNTNNIVALKNIQKLTKNEYKYLNLQANNISNSIIARGRINVDFHNHNESEIHFKLPDNRYAFFTIT